jgi:hypothetical protein
MLRGEATAREPAKWGIARGLKTGFIVGLIIGLMEPLLIGESSRHPAGLNDLALELVQKSAGFRRSVPQSLLASRADLVRAMHCYYSNLIEGHYTRRSRSSASSRATTVTTPRSYLQLEAKAHIEIQRWIDSGSLA